MSLFSISTLLRSASELINGSQGDREAATTKSTPQLRLELQQITSAYPQGEVFERQFLLTQIFHVAALVLSGDARTIGAIKAVLDDRNEQYS